MKKIIIILILISLFSISCVYAEDNVTNQDKYSNDINTITETIESDITLNDNTSNEKYYWTNPVKPNDQYYFYKNGTVVEIYNNYSRDYLLNDEQIDFYLENGYFSYALAYIKAHGGNLTYDEVYNAEGVIGTDGFTKDFIFYNNGYVLPLNGLSYPFPYITHIDGRAMWPWGAITYMNGNTLPVSAIYESKIWLIYRYPNGKFVDSSIVYYTPTNVNKTESNQNNTLTNTNNTTTQQNKSNILINTLTQKNTQNILNINTTQQNTLIIVNNTQTQEKSNTKMLYTNNSKNKSQNINNTTTNKNKIDKSAKAPVKSISNILVVSLMGCLLVPMGIYRKRKM